MEEKYIKFKEGDKVDLQRACKLAEKHGYKKYNIHNTLRFESYGLLLCDEEGEYYTYIGHEYDIIKDGHTELKEGDPIQNKELSNRVRLGLEEFKTLVYGGQVTQSNTDIILADIGYDVMIEILQQLRKDLYENKNN